MAINIHYWDDNQGFFITSTATGTNSIELPYEGKKGIMVYYDYIAGDETELDMDLKFKNIKINDSFNRAKIDSVNNVLINKYKLSAGKASFGISLFGNERVILSLEFVGATTEGTIDIYIIPTYESLSVNIANHVFL